LEQVEELVCRLARIEALRKPFPPSERGFSLMPPSSSDILVRAGCARRFDPAVAGKLLSTYFTNPELFQPQKEINLLFAQ